jgi:colicin import membrane protein
MLRRAQAEAEARRAADQRAFEEQARSEAEEKARIEDERERERIAAEQEKARIAAEQEKARAEADRLAQEADERRQENEQRAEEARKVEAARLAREVEEQRRADEQAKAEEARRVKEAEEKRLADAQREAAEKRRADEARAKLEAMRMEEARRIAEKFRLAREARERERGTRNSLGGPPPAPEVPEVAPWSVETDAARRRPMPTRVTVLLLMEPRRHGFAGKRRAANPVLCIGRGCYISSGPNNPADHMSRWKALGPANSVGRRAGPCRNRLRCVFRNVELGAAAAAIQPVDMGLWRHDRRDIKTVRADRTCDLIGGRLFCATPVIGHRYRAWIVPESIAARAGADALEDALEEGLPSVRSAEREDWLTNVHALPTR